jgi:hypothetical protein
MIHLISYGHGRTQHSSWWISGIQPPGCETDHSFLFGAEINNVALCLQSSVYHNAACISSLPDRAHKIGNCVFATCSVIWQIECFRHLYVRLQMMMGQEPGLQFMLLMGKITLYFSIHKETFQYSQKCEVLLTFWGTLWKFFLIGIWCVIWTYWCFSALLLAEYILLLFACPLVYRLRFVHFRYNELCTFMQQRTSWFLMIDSLWLLYVSN